MTEAISILFPCAEQKREYLEEAVASVRRQTSPRWELLVGLDPAPPAWLHDFFARADDPRIRCIAADRAGFAAALNAVMRSAANEFVAILLSDDRYAPEAIETLLAYRTRYPNVDFFHSSMRYIDARGAVIGATKKSRPSFTLDDFKHEGSPVKHLLCWRRELALRLGGMNEELSAHGCDDYDFPWRMAEAGAKFRSIKECLYEYRIHTEGPRLTTYTPLQSQIESLEKMFRSHGVAEEETCAYLQRSVTGYLAREHLGRACDDSRPSPPVACYRAADAGAAARFHQSGFRERDFFPHHFYVLPRPGPDGMQLAQEMCNVSDAAALRQALLYATEETTGEFPASLFFDDEIVWHRQQLGLPGLVANANMVVRHGRLFVTQLFSDVVQRISRRREHKTRIENRFAGWAHLSVNAIAAYARDAGLEEVCFPTSGLVIAHTDRARGVEPELFERIYDRTVAKRLSVTRSGRWWRASLRANAGRILALDRKLRLLPRDKTVCIVHDVERGFGHRGIEDAFAASADRTAPAALHEMLAVEAAAGVKATYSVVGVFLDEVRAAIEQGGHTLAFHSYEHAVAEPSLRERVEAGVRRLAPRLLDPVGAASAGRDFQQLVRCRQVDYRLKGYRPPMSRITPGLDDRHLAYFNFEWLASSAPSLGTELPALENGIAKIPIHLDDFDLHRGQTSYAEWERGALELAEARDFVAIGLHDCYAAHWLPHYRTFLEKLARRARMKTFEEVAAETALAGAVWR